VKRRHATIDRPPPTSTKAQSKHILRVENNTTDTCLTSHHVAAPQTALATAHL
jgi:hypothetical protein